MSKHEDFVYLHDQCDYQASYKGNLHRHSDFKHEGIKFASVIINLQHREIFIIIFSQHKKA